MTDRIERGAIKVIEVIGVSTDSFDDAVNQAVSKASESIRGITGIEVAKLSGEVRDGAISHYKATVKLAFVVK